MAAVLPTATADQTFVVTIEDGRYRPFRCTFVRKARGQFAKLCKLERFTDNGKDSYWTLHRAACHGDIDNHAKREIKRMAEIIRHQP